MLSVYKGNVRPVGLALVSRAQEVKYVMDKNAVALAAEGKVHRKQVFLLCRFDFVVQI